MKNAVKEIGIFILLCLAITFVLAIMFYNFNPSGKVVPSKVTYSAPEAVKEELQEATEKSEASIKMEDKVYTIEGTDLNVYKKNRSYDSGNVNPFEIPETQNKAAGTDTTTKTVKDATSSANTPEAMTQTEVNKDLSNGETPKSATKIK